MNWQMVSQKLGDPDLVPLPEPGTDLSENARGYKGCIIIFYTKRQPVKQGDKLRFEEVVYKVELCKRK
ncbi:MAG: hypothetical protein FJ134_00845 [Deltaproteobacteria bacterium]|nr:hypothetical protein [Deltaproteobacteria bacterium]